MAKTSAQKRAEARSKKPAAPKDSAPGEVRDDKHALAPSDLVAPSRSDDVQSIEDHTDADGRPTAREGLKPIGNERPHPTAAARLGKTAGESSREAFVADAHAEEDAAAEAKERKATGFQVEATRMGYYDDVRRRTGDVFDLKSAEDFSERWMRRTDGKRQKRVTTSAQELKRQTNEIREAKQRANAGILTGRDDVPRDLPTGTHNPLGD